MSDEKVYGTFDQAGLDAAYNNSAAVAGSGDIVADWERRGEIAQAEGNARLDIRYGPKPRNGIDYFKSGAEDAPLFAFIHGGYWQRNRKETFSFISAGPNAHGIDVAHIGYTLAPEATLTEITQEIDAALAQLVTESDVLGFQPGRVVLSGWSAGGHLAAHGARNATVAAAMPISGVFDLEPVRHTYINDKVHITESEADALSPFRHIGPDTKPFLVAVGGAELPELRRQSKDYADALEKAGYDVELMMPEGKDHFSVMETLADPDGALCQGLVRLIERL
jgi:arylformamidase